MIFNLTEEALAQAADILNNGGVVIIPTDTVYGIAAHPQHFEAVQRICTIKGRPTGKPIALLAAGVKAVEQFGAIFPDTAKRLAEKHWPGALTLVLPCEVGRSRPDEPGRATASSPSRYEGFRVPAHNPICKLIALCGGVLRVTSANLSGEMPALDATQALKDVGLEADMVLDAGISPGGFASTVV
jgi:L-threonylcarbamoyladenylate synthase